MWDTLLPVIIGGTLTIVGSVVTQWAIQYHVTTHKRRATMAAFAGEIQALLEIVQHRKYVEYARSTMEAIQVHNVPFAFQINVKQDYFNLYRANCDNLGLLDPKTVIGIATFYTFAKSLLEDSAREVEQGTPEAAVEVLENQIELLLKMIALGRQLVNDLTKNE